MKKSVLALMGILLLMLPLTLTGCGGSSQNGRSITAVGSSALQPLVEGVATDYANKHPNDFINVQGGGTGTGLSQIQEGAVQIGNSDLYTEQKAGINAKKLVDHKVAVIGITPVINKQVKVSNLTYKQLTGIFTGEITNWQQVGGQNLPIVVVNRSQGSGTRVAFERWGLGGRGAISAQEQDSSGMVRSIIASTPGGISYLGFNYVDKSVKTIDLDGVAPLNKNVLTNKWKIWSYEHMYTKGKPNGLTKDFINYILSPHIQNTMVHQLGYIPVNQMKYNRSLQAEMQVSK